MKFSVIMASYLGDYPGAAKNREQKIVRAVNSFLKQTHEDKELIIISDGCQKTIDIYNKNWKDNKSIKLFASNKLPLYSGAIRSIGLKMAEGDLIAYLDNDDVFGKNHLKTIHDQFNMNENDWVYYDDYMVLDEQFKKFHIRYVETRYGSIGTSSICHKNFNKYKLKTDIDWFDGYGHDFLYVMKLALSGTKFNKLPKMPEYIVCHYANGDF
jgi:glycosyltransferase involved in cell wall biosynthesis